MTLGYLVEYKVKTDTAYEKEGGDVFGERRIALMEQEMLVQVLQHPTKYLVKNVVLVDMDQYRMNYSEAK